MDGSSRQGLINRFRLPRCKSELAASDIGHRVEDLRFGVPRLWFSFSFPLFPFLSRV